jgi:quinol---cytochrome c reductase iron-sulfur subunit
MAERVVLALFGGTVLASIGFIVAYATGNDTQLLGIALALALGFLAAAAIVAARFVLPQGQDEEEREAFAIPGDEPPEQGTAEQAEVAGQIESIGEGFTRRKLIAAGGAAAGTALGAAMIIPAASMGPKVGNRLYHTPWRANVPLVTEEDQPIIARELEEGTFLTAFPKGANKRDLAAPVVVMRVDPEQLDLPAERQDWAPDGLLAYSKICTHASCAINLFRTPRFPPRAPKPALVCPCHYSTFDVGRAGKVIFGPAGRPLPQLPLKIDGDGLLVAGGNFSGPIGAGWRGVLE